MPRARVVPLHWPTLFAFCAVLAVALAIFLSGSPFAGAAGGLRSERGEDGSAPGATAAEVFRHWLPAALAGDASAQYELGRAYADGAVTEADLAEAAFWFQRAADHGSARAQLDLAILYTKGLGVPQDYVQSYVWFDLAAARLGAGIRHDQAAEMRDMMAAFLTPEQLAEAKRQSAEWQGKGKQKIDAPIK